MSQQRIQFRRDTSAAWALENPTLALGEPGFETDTSRMKIGDGERNWLNLSYEGTGPQGIQGPAGAVGPAGQQGDRGNAGSTGPQGIQGQVGPTGPAGQKGNTGNTGAIGPQGIQGIQGEKGEQGDTGATGGIGPQGIQGPKGDGASINIKGTATTWPPDNSPTEEDLWILPDPVPAGTPAGYFPGDGALWTGSVWQDIGAIRGEVGPQGPKGSDGATGSTGPQGSQGPQGDTGPQGAQGETGLTGPDGANGADGPAGGQGPQGVAGADGAAGTNGTNGTDAREPVFSIGTVVSGSVASVTLTGTYPNLVLNFVVPEGSGGGDTPNYTTTFVENPVSKQIVISENYTLTASAVTNDSGGISYQWEKMNEGSTVWQNINNATSTSYTPPSSTEGSTTYRCKATTLNTLKYSTSALVVVSISGDPDGLVWTDTELSRRSQDGGPSDYLWDEYVAYIEGIEDAIYTSRYHTLDGMNWTAHTIDNQSGTYDAWKTNLPMHYINGVYTNGLMASSNGQNFVTASWLADNTTVYFYSAAGSDDQVYLSMQQDSSYPNKSFGIYVVDPNGGLGEPKYTYTSSNYRPPNGKPDIRWAKFIEASGGWIITDNTGIWTASDSNDGPEWELNKVVEFDNGGGPAFLVTKEPDAPKEVIIAPSGNKVYLSEDGVNFTQYTLPTSSNWWCCGYGDGKYFLMTSGLTTTMCVSEDGLNWTQQLKNEISATYGIAYHKVLERWVISDKKNTGSYRYGYSFNG